MKAQPIIRFCYNRSKSLFNFLSSSKSRQARSKKKTIVTSIAQAYDFVDLCAIYGYYAEEHVVQTGDGYLLGLHRLGWKRGEEGVRINAGEGSVQKKVVYLHHGLLMNSEVWVCLTEKERCLPFMLVEKGYDVWVKRSYTFTDQHPLTVCSLEITVGTSTLKNLPNMHQIQTASGTFQWINSHFTTSRTASNTYLKQHLNHHCPMLASRKVPHKHLQLCLYILPSTTRLMSLLH